jgi:hypothetical protein
MLTIVQFTPVKFASYRQGKAVTDPTDNVSQSNELLGLAESGVVAINLVQTPTQTSQGKSTFTKTVSSLDANGNPVTTSREQSVQNVNFTQNGFYREFADNPVVTAQAAALPQMQGAGLVRDEKTGNCQRKYLKARTRNNCNFASRKKAIVPNLRFMRSKKLSLTMGSSIFGG